MIYINTRTENIENLNQLLNDIASGKIKAVAHLTKSGGIAFDTYEGEQENE